MQALVHLPTQDYKADDLIQRVKAVTGNAAITPEVVKAYTDRVTASSWTVGSLINKRIMVALQK